MLGRCPLWVILDQGEPQLTPPNVRFAASNDQMS
jgi:hypothetical protein